MSNFIVRPQIQKIQYPEGVRLTGWDKLVFERRIKGIFGAFFSVCDLDRCRLAILGQERDEDRHNELHAFHCDSFKKMGSAEAQALVEKTGQYVGVEITTKRIGHVPSVVVAMLSGIVLGALCAWMIPTLNAVTSAKAMPNLAHSTNVLDVLHPSPSRLLLPQPVFDAEEPLEPIFSTTVRTSQPAATARTLAGAVRNEVGEYEVSLTVTPTESTNLN